MLATKSQDTAGRAAGAARCRAASSTPVVCLQNGVENERIALRLFANVYGAVVMSPTAHLEPGVVQAYGSRGTGVIDVGRYPSGVDAVCEEIADALERLGLQLAARGPTSCASSTPSCSATWLNAVDALCEPGSSADELIELAQEEGKAALTAAGIEFVADEVNDVANRWEQLDLKPIAGRERAGSSTRQSLARGAGAVETDYLNGEIVADRPAARRARRRSTTRCAELSNLAVRERWAAQTLSGDEVLARRRRANGSVRR